MAKSEIDINENIPEIESDDDDSNSPVEPYDPSKIDIQSKVFTIDLILKRIDATEINLSTPFQRQDNLWKIKEQSRLIESLLIRIPIPAFYFDASDDNEWLVVDGLQRLGTFKSFILDQNMKLEQLEFLTQYNNCGFNELPRQMQRRIEETQITAFLINPGTPKNVKYNIFKRINTGGITLSPQEIRHAIFQGAASDFVQELAQLPEFKRATCNKVKSDRRLNQEFVLHFLAFYLQKYFTYTKGIDNYLNEGMSLLFKLSNSEKSDLKQKFITSQNTAYAIFKDDAFRKRYKINAPKKPINKALFTVWSVLLAELNDSERDKLIRNKELVIKEFMLLMSDPAFETSISEGTAAEERVLYRFEGIKKLIGKILC